MANITELQLQGDSTVHKLNDARISTTAVTTATHILTTNSGVTSIAPITATNLASVLGVQKIYPSLRVAGDFNNYKETGVLLVYTVAIQAGIQNAPEGIKYGYLEVQRLDDNRIIQRYYIWGSKNPDFTRVSETGTAWTYWE